MKGGIRTHSSLLWRVMTVSMAGLLLIMASTVARAQIVIPATPKKFVTRNTGGDQPQVTVTQPAPRILQRIYVTPLRNWSNAEGQTMLGRLMAFAAPAPGEAGPVVVILEGKVKFFMPATSKEVSYDLAKLSEADQEFIRQIAKAAEKGIPAPPKP